MNWIKNHKLISILLIVIIVSATILISSVTSGGSGNPVSNFFTGVFNKIEKPISDFAGGISENVSGIFSYKKLQSENEKLKAENEELKKQVTNLTLSANQLSELRNLKGALNYKGVGNTRDLVSGDIVSMDQSNWMKVFTINIGTESGIHEGDIVICGEGLVGRISSVGKGWSKVVSIIDESIKISFKVYGNLKLIGVIEASSNGTLEGYMLDSKAKVSEGDKLITSGMGTYPAGIEIGKVTKVKYDSDSQLEKVKVEPSTDFTTLQKVSVII